MTSKRKLSTDCDYPCPKRSKEARACSVQVEVALYRLKIREHEERGGTWEHLPRNSRYHEGVVEMECVHCRKFLPRTPEFFLKNSNNFETSKPGCESLSNTRKQPCTTCRLKLRKDHRNTPEGYLAGLTSRSSYPLLDHAWVLKQLANQNNRGYFTGFPLGLVPGNWQASIHNLNTAEKEHRPENCVLDILELNVNQGGHEGAIPSLPVAAAELFQAFLDNYDAPPLPGDKWLNALTQTRQQLGIIRRKLSQKEYDKQAHEIHLPSILSRMIVNNHNEDKIKKRYQNWTPITQEEHRDLQRLVVQKIIAQGCRCAYSGVPLTMTNGWQRLSFERLDNSRAHFGNRNLENVVFICRILNGFPQMSRAKMCHLVLGQTAVLVPANLRLSIERELEARAHVAES